MAPKPKLVYFNYRGTGELLRLLMTAGGVEFDDEQVEPAAWPSRKAESPSGQLPYMVIRGQKYTESLPLARHLAKKCSLAGRNDLECLNADIVLSLVEDLRAAYVRYKFDPILTEEQKKSLRDKFVQEKCPLHCDKVEHLLTESKSGFLVGGYLTIADLAVYDLCDQLEIEMPDLLEKYPKIKEHRQKIKALPKLSTYLSQRKETKF